LFGVLYPWHNKKGGNKKPPEQEGCANFFPASRQRQETASRAKANTGTVAVKTVIAVFTHEWLTFAARKL
jgi:hypothetical protein